MKSTFKNFSLAFVFASAFGLISSGHAAPAAANLSVSATVAANCTIAADSVAFGVYDPVGANTRAAKNATGTVATTCTNGAAAYITLSQGMNAASGSTDAAPLRQMTSGRDALGYFLYSDSGNTVWGNKASTGKADTGTGMASSLTVYGSIPAGQNVPPGSYADVVVATVTF